MASKTLGDFIGDLPRPAVMCTLVKVTGSAPQAPGARMWVAAEAFYGTLGGGELERRILAQARDMLASGAAEPVLEEFTLCRDMGQCCGGRVQIFFEPVARRRRVTLCGAGHVGRAVAETLAGMPFDVRVVDARADWAEAAAFPAGVAVACEPPDAFARRQVWSQDDAVCIFTHSHDLDLRLTRFFLRQNLGYLGLIGSTHKARKFLARLADFDSARTPQQWRELWDAKMHCPLGKSYGSKNPKIIAVAVAAELLEEWALAKRTPAPAERA